MTPYTQSSQLTHVNVVLEVPLLYVVENGGLVQVPQRRHVQHAIDAGLVHRLDQLVGQGRARVGGRLQGTTWEGAQEVQWGFNSSFNSSCIPCMHMYI